VERAKRGEALRRGSGQSGCASRGWSFGTPIRLRSGQALKPRARGLGGCPGVFGAGGGEVRGPIGRGGVCGWRRERSEAGPFDCAQGRAVAPTARRLSHPSATLRTGSEAVCLGDRRWLSGGLGYVSERQKQVLRCAQDDNLRNKCRSFAALRMTILETNAGPSLRSG